MLSAGGNAAAPATVQSMTLKRKIVVLIYFWFLDVPDERWWEGC
jgi:hypothetical protein